MIVFVAFTLARFPVLGVFGELTLDDTLEARFLAGLRLTAVSSTSGVGRSKATVFRLRPRFTSDLGFSSSAFP